MQFEHFTYLYLLCAIPLALLLFFITSAWRKRAVKKIGDTELVKSLMPRSSQRRKFIKLFFLLLAFTCFVFALANLRMGSKKEKAQREGSEIIVCFDVSRSMLAEDVKPNRLTRAQILTSQIIESLAGNKIGLIVFAGKAYVQMPLTVDARASLMYLNTVNTGMVETQGTNVGDAIQIAMQVFENGSSDTKRENKAIIIITDGESHSENTMEMAEKAADENIKLITIGVGSTQGAPIPVKKGSNTDYKKDSEGNIVLTKLNEQALEQIAATGNGKYMNLSEGSNVLKKVKEEINDLEKDKGEVYEFTEYQNHFQLFLVLGLVFLTIEFFMSDKRAAWVDKINVFDSPKSNSNA